MTVYGKAVSILVLVAVILGLLVLGGYVRDWRVEQAAAAKPEIAVDTKASEKWERQMEALTLAVAKLSEAQAAALATKYDRPDVRYVPGPAGRDGAPGAPGTPGTVVLAETTSKAPAPAGVDILTTANPTTGKVENTVVPRKVSFFGAPLKWRLYLEGGTESLTMERWRAEAGVEFRALRLGWVELQPKASVGYFPLGEPPVIEHEVRVFTGLRVTFDRP